MYISFFAVKALVAVLVRDGAGRRYGEGEHQVLELRHDVLLLSACEAPARLVALATLVCLPLKLCKRLYPRAGLRGRP